MRLAVLMHQQGWINDWKSGTATTGLLEEAEHVNVGTKDSTRQRAKQRGTFFILGWEPFILT